MLVTLYMVRIGHVVSVQAFNLVSYSNIYFFDMYLLPFPLYMVKMFSYLFHIVSLLQVRKQLLLSASMSKVTRYAKSTS